MTDLLQLAERCEQATGPDRELDADIYRHVRLGGSACPRPNGPEFTASLDAAMTLLLPWALPNIRHHPEKMRPFCQLENGIGLPFAEYRGHGSTYALALCAAALRARATA